ncbi:MAG: hypothetical protein RL757_300 [Bacteroidota bacterium]|jgi:hypothetical protein
MKRVFLSLVAVFAISLSSLSAQADVEVTTRGGRVVLKGIANCEELRQACIDYLGKVEGERRYKGANCKTLEKGLELSLPECAKKYMDKNPNLTAEQREAIAKDAIRLSDKDFCVKYSVAETMNQTKTTLKKQ